MPTTRSRAAPPIRAGNENVPPTVAPGQHATVTPATIHQEKLDQSALAAMLAAARSARYDEDDEDSDYEERRRCECNDATKLAFQEWLLTLENVSYCLGEQSGVNDLQALSRRFNLRHHPMLLGEGKFADVYRAYDHERRQYVAIKLVSFKDTVRQGSDRLLQTQLKREVELLASVNHENVLACHGVVPLTFCARLAIVTDCYSHELYYIMSKVAEAAGNDRCLPVKAAAGCFKQVVAALEYLHSCRIMFRDLKAENVMVERDGRAKLIDFGWARPLEDGERSTTLCGTLDYLSPELIEGRPADLRTDLFSLGVLGYEMLVGAPPFEAPGTEDTYRRISRVRFTFPPWMPVEASDACSLLAGGLLRHDPLDCTEAAEILRSDPWLTQQPSAAADLPAAEAAPAEAAPAEAAPATEVPEVTLSAGTTPSTSQEVAASHLRGLSRKELQAAAKAAGLRANAKSCELIEQLSAQRAQSEAEAETAVPATPAREVATCVACEDAPRATRFWPCGHAMLCALCTIKSIDARGRLLRCTLCRAEVGTLQWNQTSAHAPNSSMPTYLAQSQNRATSSVCLSLADFLANTADAANDEPLAREAQSVQRVWAPMGRAGEHPVSAGEYQPARPLRGLRDSIQQLLVALEQQADTNRPGRDGSSEPVAP